MVNSFNSINKPVLAESAWDIPLKFQGIHFEKPNNSSWVEKEVLGGPFGNFEVLNGPVL